LGDSSQNKEFVYALIANAAILQLAIWRFYEHYVDYSIVICYKKIVYCEKILRIPKDITLKTDLSNDRGHFFLDIIALVLIGITVGYLFYNRSEIVLFIGSILVICCVVIGIFYFRYQKKRILLKISDNNKLDSL